MIYSLISRLVAYYPVSNFYSPNIFRETQSWQRAIIQGNKSLNTKNVRHFQPISVEKHPLDHKGTRPTQSAAMEFQIVKNIFYFLICVASVGSNSLLIAILLRFEHLRTTANMFVLNLAFCDVAIVLLSIPFTVAIEGTTSYPFGELGCKILMPGATAAFNSAAFTLLAIAIDRFYAIMFPMRARLQSCKTKSLAVCLLHGISISSVIPYAIHQK